MSTVMQEQFDRYDPIFDEFVEDRQKAERPVTAKALARELGAVSDLHRSEAYFLAEDYCARKGFIRARSTQRDMLFPLPVCLMLIAAIILVLRAVR